METYGGISSEAMNLLKLFSRHCDNMPAYIFLSYARSRISVCLQTSNANLSLLAAQRMSIGQLMGFQVAQPTVTYGYTKPINTNYLAKKMDQHVQTLKHRKIDHKKRTHALNKRVSFNHGNTISRIDVPIKNVSFHSPSIINTTYDNLPDITDISSSSSNSSDEESSYLFHNHSPKRNRIYHFNKIHNHKNHTQNHIHSISMNNLIQKNTNQNHSNHIHSNKV